MNSKVGRKIAAGVVALSLSAGLVGPASAVGVDPAVAEAQIDEWVANGDINQRQVKRLERKVDRAIRKAERKASRGKSDRKVIRVLANRLQLTRAEVREILTPAAEEAAAAEIGTPDAGTEEPDPTLVDLTDLPADVEAAFDLAVVEDAVEKIAERRAKRQQARKNRGRK